MLRRLCIACPATFEAKPGRSRCAACQVATDRARDERRGSSTARGYDAEYVRNAGKVRSYAKAHRSPCEICWQAFADGETVSVDHIVPKSRGGTNEITNLRPTHSRCNSRRGNRTDNGPTLTIGPA